jgi:hypothetical protein
VNKQIKNKGDTVLEKPTIEKAMGAVGKGFLAQTVVSVIRAVLNGEIKKVKPGQLVKAIQDNTSIWAAGGSDIQAIAARIPSAAIAAGRPMYQKAVEQYGSATELVLAWLKEDNPVFFSLIINTEGGIAWFDRQVQEMTTNLGLEYK